MTMNNVYKKLRYQNITNYYILIFCIMLSILLVNSYALMFLSPTVQNIFPAQGDSNKQASIIFGIAIVGCAVFTTYASSLFFRYKSRETGILLALGAKKSQIKRALFLDLITIVFISAFLGFLLSIPLSYGIWKLFQMFIIDTREMAYQVGWRGFIFGGIFCFFVTLSIILMGFKFIRRSNIIDIINQHRKSEPIKEVQSWYGITGVLLLIGGITLGYAVPLITLRVFEYMMPSIWSLTYLFSLLGIYKIMIFVVMKTKKGKHLKKYYKNIVSNSMMKFCGRQTVKNMCVISFLIAGALFAAFYTPTVLSGMFISISNNPIDYSFYYKSTEDQINREEIYALAHQYDVRILSYDELESVSLIVNGVHADFEGDGGKITRKYIDKIGYEEFFSQSEFNKVTGQNVHLKPGEYLTIISSETTESIHYRHDDLKLITNPITNVSHEVKFVGTVVFEPFAKPGTTKYVISDDDYMRYTKNLPPQNFEKFILFNVDNPSETYDFAYALKNEIILRSSEEVAISNYYDDYEKLMAEQKGESYWGDENKIDLSMDNNTLFNNWKYYPAFRVLNKQDLLKNMAVFLMLFIYITIICFVAIAIIAYTRSITIAINNKNLFSDLRKLGANNHYIEAILKKQLKKIFIIPILVGSLSIYIFYFMILFGNSGGSLSLSEYIALVMDIGIILLSGMYMFGVYKMTFRKVKHIIGI